MAYDKHYWNINEPITQANMNRIENGIADADTTANNAVSSITNLSNVIGTGFSTTNTVTTQVSNLQSQINSNRIDNIQEIQNATAEVMAAHKETTTSTSNKYTNLLARFMELDDKIGETEGKADTANNAIDNARIPENGPSYSSLRSRLNGIDTTISTINTQISNINDEIDIARQGEDSLDDRLDNMTTTSNDIDHRLEILATEISDARKAKDNIERPTLTARLVDIINNSESYTNTAISTATGVLGSQASSGEPHTVKTYVDEKTAEITDAHRALNDTLVNRFDDIESAISTLESGSATASDLTNLTNRVNAAESTINTHTTNISTNTSAIATLQSAVSHTKDENDDNDLGGLEQRMTGAESRLTTLESSSGGSATIVISNPTYSNGTPVIDSPSAGIDYLIKGEGNDDQYYYWKYINNNWELISGGSGGGTGTSSGKIVTDLNAITEPDENTDYFVGNNTIGYTHYRYIAPAEGAQIGTFVRILPKNILANASVNNNGKPIITTIDDANTNVLNSFNALKTVNCTTTYDTDGITPKSYALSFTDVNGQEYAWDLAAGGGGSSYTVQFLNESGDLELYVPNNANSAIVSAKIYARLGQELLSQTGSITVKYKAESAEEYTTARVISGVVNNTTTNIDIIDLLEQNAITNIQLTASIQPEDTPITRNITYTIHRVPMSIEAYNYNPASVKTNNFDFQYYCIGSNLAKIVHFIIDGVETTEDVGIPANTDLLTKRIVVGELARGMHSLRVYFTVGSYSSNEINTYFLYDDGTQENKPIIALSTNKSTIQDGETLNLYYTVYTKGQPSTEEITLETYTMAGNVKNIYEVKSYTNIDNSIEKTIPIINYPASGTFYMTMTAKHTVDNVEYTESKTITVTITEYQSAYDSQMVRAGAANLIYEYEAAGRTNNDSDKATYEYEFTSVSGDSETFTGTSSNFNWASNGYVDGSSLLISGGATHTINVPLFLARTQNVSLETDTNNDDILLNGRTFEIDYEVNTASNLNAEIASFGNGLKITPSVSYLVPQGTTVTVNSHGLIEREDKICAAYLATGKRMHMVFVIEPKSTTPTSQGEYHQCVNIYINGEFVNSCPYALSDNFSTSSTFTIGSDTCIIKLYSVRMYNRGLTNDEVLRNYMMAPNTKLGKINRFAANDVLDSNKLVDYSKARNKFNCLLITGEISPYKKKTKTPSGVTLTKPDTANLSYTTEFNLLDKKSDGTYYSSNNVQGTSSQTYPIHNLKVYLAKEVIDDNTGEAISKKYKYSLKGKNGIGESTLCWKADYMSTDHANTFNANFANDLFTDKLPSQVTDPQVQNTVYGIRCLLFQRDAENSTPVFIADGCLNNDKGNNNAFGLVDKSYDEAEISEGVTRPLNDTTRQKWEFTNNSSALDFFQADGLLAINNDEYYAKTAFESTYPDEGDLEDEGLQPNYNHLQVLMTWVHQRANYWDADDTPTGTVTYNESTGEYTTTGTVYTYNNIPYSNVRDYKKAIFKNEFTRHFNLNHVLTYHLFSEFIALCDNRAKNMFLRCDDVRTEEVLDISDNIIFSGNNNPNASFFTNTTNIGTNDDPIYALSNADQINWTGSKFAMWYPVLYDLDSCYGVENVGRITIPYDADWNYIYPPDNKKQFSGVESRLWLMVEDAFATELKTLAQTLYPNSLNYNTFYTTQIQAMSDSVCPAIINQDMLLKFNAYWADGFIDYSLPNTPHVYRDYKYIQRGSRAYQKDTFIKLRSNYLSSKYITSNFMNDQIRFRSSVILPVSNSGITLTTNQTLYPAITYGDNKAAIRSENKIGPGESVTLKASDQVGNTDTIHIGGASALTDIGDISKFEPYNLDVSGGVNLKSLIVGSNVVNASTNTIDGLGSCALLETLNVRNCTGFSGTLNLSGNRLIKNVYASGSGITNIELREGGNLTNIEYGALTSTIKIINHGRLQSFVYENSANNHYANVTKLWIENTPKVPIVDIVRNRLPGLTNGLRLTGINLTIDDTLTAEEQATISENYINFLEMLVTPEYITGKYLSSAGIQDLTQPPYISGDIYVKTIKESLVTKCSKLYPDLTIHMDVTITEHAITYFNVDANGNKTTELFTLYCTASDNIPEPIQDQDPITGKYYIQNAPAAEITNDGIQWVPTCPADAEYIYRFGTYTNAGRYVKYSGWTIEGKPSANLSAETIGGPMTILAKYPEASRIKQQYSVRWHDYDGSVLNTVSNLEYGLDISALNAPSFTKKKKVNNGSAWAVFTGWDKPLVRITGDIDVYSQWDVFNGGISNISDLNDLTPAMWYYLTNLSNEQRDALLDDHMGNSLFNIQLGNDFDYDEYIDTYNLLETTTYSDNNKLYFDGSTQAIKIFDGLIDSDTGLQKPALAPLNDLSQSFTLAIDFKFLLNASQYTNGGTIQVLASCLSATGSSLSGFLIGLNKNTSEIIVQWGTQTVVIDYAAINISNNTFTSATTYRNMIVLRHNGESSETMNQLYVYYATPSSNPKYYNNNGVTRTVLTWNSTTAVTNPLMLGGNYYTNSNTGASSIEDTGARGPAQGIIYYAKYWAADIGNNNCLNLAQWPHETVAYKIMGYANQDSATGGNTKLIVTNEDNSIRINFTPAQVVGDRMYNFNYTGGTAFGTRQYNNETLTGWGNSYIRDFCQNRIYNALPTAYQSLIVPAYNASWSLYGNSNYITDYTSDYIYIPSNREVNPNLALTDNTISEAIQAWPWLDVSNLTQVYTDSSGNLELETLTSELDLRFLRLQFFDIPVTFSTRIFHTSANPGSTTWTINNVSITAQHGDIWYPYNDATKAYIFVTDYTDRGIEPNIIVTRGGWIASKIWSLRTHMVTGGTASRGNAQYFYRIESTGEIVASREVSTTVGNETIIYTDRALVPEFSI